jgi:hypothetical protein
MSATAAAFAESGHGGPPLVLPPNFRDVTAEKVGTVMAIVVAPAAGSKFSGQLTDGVVRTGKFRP